MKRVSKFVALERFLEKQTDEFTTMTFDEIERIIGQKLCPSAYKYTAYWSPSKTHTLPNMILDTGHKIIEKDLERQQIKLQRIK